MLIAFMLASQLHLAAQHLSSSQPTAAEIVARIQKNVGIPWQSQTVDKFIAGDANTPVTGIAVVMMSTLEVLQQAVARGDNFIITHEPTFYNGEDNTSFLDQHSDPVLAAKRDYIRQHGLVIWRFHDHLASAATRRHPYRHGPRARMGKISG